MESAAMKLDTPWKESNDISRQNIKKQRHHFADKGLHSQSYGFSSNHQKYRCESWTIKKTECQRIDAFQLWCCRRPLRVPWTAGTSNKSILKEINGHESEQTPRERRTGEPGMLQSMGLQRV